MSSAIFHKADELILKEAHEAQRCLILLVFGFSALRTENRISWLSCTTLPQAHVLRARAIA
jgi:hypothetical protein